MLALFIVFFFPIFCYSSEDFHESYDLADFHGMPSAIVGGHVNVITGDFIDYEVDCVLPGPQPFILDRVYSSSQLLGGTLKTGWSINYNHSAMYYREGHTKNIKNYFVVADGLGTMLKYRGLHKDKCLDGGYRIEEKSWEKGLTNISGEGISGKSNLSNNECWIDPRNANIRMGNGDVLYFQGATEKVLAAFGKELKDEGSTAFFLPEKKVKLNRITEFYHHQHDSLLSQVRFQGSSNKELGYYQFSFHDSCLGVETSGSSDFYMKFKLMKHINQKCYFLHEVERPFAPCVHYDYEDYGIKSKSGSKEKIARRIYQKSYPEHRYTRVKYHPKGQVKRLLKPIGETDEPLEEYKFKYHAHEKHGYLYGSTDVFDAYDAKKTYNYDKSRLLSIETFRGQGNLYIPHRIENFHWGNGNNGYKEGHYIGKTVEDLGHNTYSGAFLEYDSFGNVTKESTFGNLSGLAPETFLALGFYLPYFVENYAKEMVYTQDQKNLLIEEKDFRKKKNLRYWEGTNLVAAEYLSDHQTICKRSFFFYNDDGFMTKQIVDDGSNEDVNDLTNVQERLITEYKARTSYPYGLAEQEVCKAYDRSSGTEKQLKRIKKKHSIEGWVLQEDLFDEDDKYISSKEYRYNSFGKVIYEKDPCGAVIERAYDKNNNLIEEKGPLPGFCKLFSYDYSNRLIKEEEILEGLHLTKTYRYNKKSERIEETDFAGNVTKYFYDELGREIGAETPAIFTEGGFVTLKTSTEYNLLNHPIVKIDSLGNKTKTLFTIRGKPYSTEYPDGTFEKTYYDLDGVVKKSIDKLGNTTEITVDYQGRPLLVKVFSSSGELLKESSSKYSAFHLIEETDALGCKTKYEYDFAGRLIRKTRGSSLEEYAYDSLSRLSKITSWTSENDAIIIQKHYDNMNRVIEETTSSFSGNLQSQVRYEYNALNNVTKEIRKIDEKGDAITCMLYNARGDLIETINPDGTSTKIFYEYQVIDARGERGTRITTIDPKGILTIIDKNALGFEKRGEKKNLLGETIELWDILYTVKGEKSKRIDVAYSEGKQIRHTITEWKWDSLGRLQELTEGFSSPDSKTTSISYNNLSQKESITKPSGRKIFYSYDTLGRVSRWHASDNSFNYSYSYDAMDNPIQIDDLLYNTSTKKEYDSEGRLIEEQQSNGHTVCMHYDRIGRVQRLIYPDKSSISYEYDGSLLKTIRRFSNQEIYYFEALEYDLMGRLKKAILPLKAGFIEMSYDIMGRTRKIDSPHWRELVDEYDAVGNLLSRTIQDHFGNLQESFSYDDLNQLIEEKGAASHTYLFDSLSNRLKEDDAETTINTLNQTLQRKECAYHYDADGNLIHLEKPNKSFHFAYDAAGRMTSCTSGSTQISYRYDETNRRQLKCINGSETKMIYHGECELGTLEERRILSTLGLGAEIGDAIAIEKGNTILVSIHDHNGNLICLIDGITGKPAYTARYSAFGTKMQSEGAEPSWGFSSKRLDPETGLIFFGQRYYDPESGRFVTKDPLGDNHNLYAYVSNNPLTHIDLFGLFDMPMMISSTSLNVFENAGEGSYSRLCGIGQAGLDFGLNTLHSFETGCAHLGFEMHEFGFEEKMNFLGGIQFSQNKRMNALESNFTGIMGIDPSDELFQFYRSATTFVLEGGTACYGVYGAAKGLMSIGRLARAPASIEMLLSGGAESVFSGIKLNRSAGGHVTRFTEHGLQRAIQRGVTDKAIFDALNSPLKIKEIRTDHLGRPSQRFIGMDAEVVINPSTKQIISVNPTSTNKANKLIREVEKQCK